MKSCSSVVAGALLGLISTVSLTAAAAESEAGRLIYSSNCVACHGMSGQADADSPVVEALGVMPADFSDPLFNSREPAGDWEMVIGLEVHALEQRPGEVRPLDAHPTAHGDRLVRHTVNGDVGVQRAGQRLDGAHAAIDEGRALGARSNVLLELGLPGARLTEGERDPGSAVFAAGTHLFSTWLVA